MIPNGAAYNNFPPFATNGTKTPPGGSPESAKYALGMVPADTFPAEWANYLFYGATAGITRLNADTGSIKKEINNVLDNFNITPDATLTNQLMAALNKLKAEAVLEAHPVGSLYWTSSSEHPAVTFGGGTWVQIKDKFVYAMGDNDTANATGGVRTNTLTVDNIPKHDHTFSHTHKYTPSGTIASTSGGTDNKVAGGGSHNHKIGYYFAGGNDFNVWNLVVMARSGYEGFSEASVTAQYVGDHSHSAYFTGSQGTTTSQSSSTTSSYGKATPDALNNMPPYTCKYCWERTA